MIVFVLIPFFFPSPHSKAFGGLPQVWSGEQIVPWSHTRWRSGAFVSLNWDSRGLGFFCGASTILGCSDCRQNNIHCSVICFSRSLHIFDGIENHLTDPFDILIDFKSCHSYPTHDRKKLHSLSPVERLMWSRCIPVLQCQKKAKVHKGPLSFLELAICIYVFFWGDTTQRYKQMVSASITSGVQKKIQL